ncbi:MAG: LPS export ABC transporter periplasmic protein LptC [Halorhodospira sp.]
MAQGRLLFLLLAALATALLGVLLTRQPDEGSGPSAEDTPPQERPDFFLEGFELVEHDEQGARRTVLRGELGEHFPERDELAVQAPRLAMRSHAGAAWRARAPRGTADREAQSVALHEAVTIHRPATEERPHLTVETRDLHIDLEAGEAVTEAPVTAREPAGTMRGTGMTLDYRRDQLQLHANVRGQYELR